jgi:type IV pilus assembly protein PilW
MVGLVVALLVSVAAANLAISFTAQQRQSLGASGSALNAQAVMSALRDDISVAGLGFFGDQNLLCNKISLSHGATQVVNGGDFAPLNVTRETAGDRISVLWGSRVESGANVRLRAASNGSSASLNSFLPTAVGDAVLIAPGTPSNTVPCMVRSVTAVAPSTATTPQLLTFANTGYHNQVAFALNPGFDDNARVTQLGALNWVVYRVDAGNLVLERPMEGTSAIIARNVISFRVQYGVASTTPGAQALESWVDPTGGFATLNAAVVPRVRALRVGIITRSPQPEKPDAAGNCSATDTKPALWGAAPENLSNADWACWRYRSSTVIVPLRNIVMGLRA